MTKFLVLGLGSMGKRRVRCLKSLGYSSITGFDFREDRRQEAKEKYGIETLDSVDSSTISAFDVLIISTPPDQHTHYAKLAIDNLKPAFIEGSVLLNEVKELIAYNKNQVFLAPSCTLKFHPIIKDISSLIKDKKYGKVTNFSYHSGQFLPDWHPWENVKDFYVSKRETGAGREIVPFELTWIVDAIGWPNDVKGVFGKTLEVGAEIDDTYAFLLDYKTFFGSIIVDVAARFATRNLIINLERAQLLWNWEDGVLKLYEADSMRWISFHQPESLAAAGYNKNIIEKMYIDEIDAFIMGIKNPANYPNSLEDDLKVLQILDKIEKSYGGF
ncbi:MAG: Gfo/Idh/MocA family oxidoreductase [Bacteroidota bacterium]